MIAKIILTTVLILLVGTCNFNVFSKKLLSVLCALLAVIGSLFFLSYAPFTTVLLLPLSLIIFQEALFCETEGKGGDLGLFHGASVAFCAIAIYVPMLSDICVG